MHLTSWKTHRWRRLLQIALIAFAWGASFVASLAVSKMELPHGGFLCGAWGCLPETAPLLSVHLMWLTLLSGVASLSRLAVPTLQAPKIWTGVFLLACGGVAILLAVETAIYLSRGGEFVGPGVWLRFAAYHLLRLTDVPLLEIGLSAGLFRFLGRLKQREKEYEVGEEKNGIKTT